MPKEDIFLVLSEAPESPGVYKMISAQGKILYVGKAKNIQNRLAYYTASDLPTRIAKMVSLVSSVEYVITNSETEAILLEARLINTHKPKFNILLKDDKSFPRILLRTDHDFPQILKYRSKHLATNGKSFGPFASASQVDVTLEELHKIFKLRSCGDNYFAQRKRPCLQYQIKACSAPCVGKINKQEYQELVQQVDYFLSGKSHDLQKHLSHKMEEYSAALQYEKAAEVRDKIKALSYIQLKYGATDLTHDYTDIIALVRESDICAVLVAMYKHKNFYGYKTYFPSNTESMSDSEILQDFIGQFYSSVDIPGEIITNVKGAINGINITNPTRGNKKDILENMAATAIEELQQQTKKSIKQSQIFAELKNIFKLPKEPERIEVYDNSHIMGQHAVGAMIVATPDGFDKKEYRTYNLERYNTKGGDDYQMLREVLERRLAKMKVTGAVAPDLMIIDGGIGHMSTVRSVMDGLGIHIPFVCMSKGPDRNAGHEIFHIPNAPEFTINKDDPVMKFLQILRDEAHNHAIKTHRKKRSVAIKFSTLDGIEGIGRMRKKDLLSFFGSVEAIRNASVEEIAKISTIGQTLAQKIYRRLRNEE